MNVKPGDLAIVVSSISQENIGRIVTVIRLVVAGERFAVGRRLVGDGNGWLVQCDRPLVITFEGKPVGTHCTRVYRDDCLRPISGVPVDDEVTDDLKEPAI